MPQFRRYVHMLLVDGLDDAPVPDFAFDDSDVEILREY